MVLEMRQGGRFFGSFFGKDVGKEGRRGDPAGEQALGRDAV
jgi:hypothetical protein